MNIITSYLPTASKISGYLSLSGAAIAGASICYGELSDPSSLITRTATLGLRLFAYAGTAWINNKLCSRLLSPSPHTFSKLSGCLSLLGAAIAGTSICYGELSNPSPLTTRTAILGLRLFLYAGITRLGCTTYSNLSPTSILSMTTKLLGYLSLYGAATSGTSIYYIASFGRDPEMIESVIPGLKLFINAGIAWVGCKLFSQLLSPNPYLVRANELIENTVETVFEQAMKIPKRYIFFLNAITFAAGFMISPDSSIFRTALLASSIGVGILSIRGVKSYRDLPTFPSPPQMDPERLVDISADSRGFNIHIETDQITAATIDTIFQRMDQWLDRLGIPRIYEEDPITAPFELRIEDEISNSNIHDYGHNDQIKLHYQHNCSSIILGTQQLDLSIHWSRTHGDFRRFLGLYNATLPLPFNVDSPFPQELLERLSEARSILRWLSGRCVIEEIPPEREPLTCL